MAKDKNKNQYGTFLSKKKGLISHFRQRTALIIMAVVFVGGTGIAAYKGIASLGHKEQAITSDDIISEIPGWWIQQYFGASVCEKEICKSDYDLDEDKLTNFQEFYYHTNPANAYTAGDELNDGQLLAMGFDPSKPGRVTFEEVISDINLFGESLVFDKDVKQIVAESNDVSKIQIPELKADEIEIQYEETSETYKAYANEMKVTMNKYFPESNVYNIAAILKSGDEAQVSQIAIQSQRLSEDLKNIKVPQRFLMFHKYNILRFQLLAEIVLPPSDMSSESSEIWYDKVQAFMVVEQRLSFEEQSLKLSDVQP
jgi:hypothetical protein